MRGGDLRPDVESDLSCRGGLEVGSLSPLLCVASLSSTAPFVSWLWNSSCLRRLVNWSCKLGFPPSCITGRPSEVAEALVPRLSLNRLSCLGAGGDLAAFLIDPIRPKSAPKPLDAFRKGPGGGGEETRSLAWRCSKACIRSAEDGGGTGTGRSPDSPRMVRIGECWREPALLGDTLRSRELGETARGGGSCTLSRVVWREWLLSPSSSLSSAVASGTRTSGAWDVSSRS